MYLVPGDDQGQGNWCKLTKLYTGTRTSEILIFCFLMSQTLWYDQLRTQPMDHPGTEEEVICCFLAPVPCCAPWEHQFPYHVPDLGCPYGATQIYTSLIAVTDLSSPCTTFMHQRPWTLAWKGIGFSSNLPSLNQPWAAFLLPSFAPPLLPHSLPRNTSH